MPVLLGRIIALGVLAIAAQAAEPDWAAVEKHAVEFLQEYVRIASINPPADTAPTAALIQRELEKNGLVPKVYHSGPGGQTNLVVRLKGRDSSKKPLLLLNHMDVVPVDAKAWGMDPFGAIIRDGFIWGRGTLDMKGIGVEHLMSLIALHNAGVMPARDIVMICTADEESGGERGIQWMMENHYAEIDAEYVLDEGGMGSRDALAPGKLVFGISVGDKVLVWLHLHAKGTAGHGSQPIPDNANLILLEAIRKAMALPEGGKSSPVVEEMKRAIGTPFAQNKFTSAIQRNTISLTTLSAGVGSPPRVNVIPSTSEAGLDCRVMPGTNTEEFISDMKARINDPRVTVEIINVAPDPGVSSTETPLYAAMRRAILKQHPDAVVTPMVVPFGTDSAYLHRRGAIKYGLTPMILDTATAATMHSDQERIPVSEFLLGIHIFYDVLASEF
ncbi:MAG TPA: M20/M25/M40 family metallo-hydrolase [Bryobacteraceae bacterium]|nr:M20/M25/M40 family metallo-hydrolase [Bryobacteraceae bacterium]